MRSSAHFGFSVINKPCYQPAICYSGYRKDQSPSKGVFPSETQIEEDLRIVSQYWSYIRLYDCSVHAERVLKIIKQHKLNIKVMLGAALAAEINNPGCPWHVEIDESILIKNKRGNTQEIESLIKLANRYPEIIFSLSVGNEASVEWTDHKVPTESLVQYARKVKSNTQQPVTFCENYVPWLGELDDLAAELDFISLHTYPVWEYKSVEEALDYSKHNYYSVKERFVNKPVIITEAGWTTKANGRGIEPWNASAELQKVYCQQLVEWISNEHIMTFLFEAFDEPWKGSDDPEEPEKHWGLFYLDRSPKLVMREGLIR